MANTGEIFHGGAYQFSKMIRSSSHPLWDRDEFAVSCVHQSAGLQFGGDKCAYHQWTSYEDYDMGGRISVRR